MHVDYICDIWHKYIYSYIYMIWYTGYMIYVHEFAPKPVSRLCTGQYYTILFNNEAIRFWILESSKIGFPDMIFKYPFPLLHNVCDDFLLVPQKSTNLTNPTMHWTYIPPFCSKNVYNISVTKMCIAGYEADALWNMGLLHCGIVNLVYWFTLLLQVALCNR